MKFGKIMIAALAVLLTGSIALNLGFLIPGIREKITPWVSRVPQSKQVLETVRRAVQKPPLQVRSISYDKWDKTISVNFQNMDDGVLGNSPYQIHPQIKTTFKSYPDTIRISGDFKPEETYTLRFEKGLTSLNGSVLQKNAAISIRIPKRDPEIDFLTTGPYFPLHSEKISLIYQTVNIPVMSVKIMKAFENNLNPYSLYDSDRMIQVAATEVKHQDPANQTVLHELDLLELLPQKRPGVYLVQMWGEDTYGSNSNILILTDMAIHSAVDEAHRKIMVHVRSLQTGKPVSGASVQVLSQKNQPVAHGETDHNGLLLADFLPTYSTEQDSVHSILVKKDSDISYYPLYGKNCYQSSNWIKDTLPLAFLFPERGICRPGETIDLSIFLRKYEEGKLPALSRTPCRLILRDPLGHKIMEKMLMTDANGFAELTIPISAKALTGTYTVECGSDENNCWNRTSFSVASYLPDQIAVSLQIQRELYSIAEDSIPASVLAKYYFGMKMDQGSCKLMINAIPIRVLENGYQVGMKNNANESYSEDYSDQQNITDGQAQFNINLARYKKNEVPHELQISATVQPPAGRAVTAGRKLTLFPNHWLTGLKQGRSNANGQEIELKLLTGNSEMAKRLPQTPQEIRCTLFRQEWDYILVQNDSRFHREWKLNQTPLPEFTQTVRTGDPAKAVIFSANAGKPLGNGCYRLCAELNGKKSEIDFWYEQGESGIRAANPFQMTFQTDAPEYLPGSTATIIFRAESAGHALIVCGANGIEQIRTQEITAPGEQKIQVMIPANAPHGTYSVGVTAVGKRGTGFIRNFGVAKLKINQAHHRLKIQLSAPDKARPEEVLHLRAELTDAAGKPTGGMIRVFAVDEGVLSLTRFKTPDIFNFFFGSHDWNVSFYDLYDQLFPELRLGPDGKIGGDKSEGVRPFAPTKLLELKLEQSARVVLKPIPIPESGKAEFDLPLPDHTGAMRIMCVGVSPDGAGSTEHLLKLHDGFSVNPTLPRVFTEGDKTELSFTLVNLELPQEDYTLEITLPKQLRARGETVFRGTLANGKSTVVKVPVEVLGNQGHAELQWTFRSGDRNKQKKVPLNFRSALVEQTVFTPLILKPGERMEFQAGNPDFYGLPQEQLLLTPSLSAFLPGAMDWLNRYPYGCLEQTASGAFPFLALPQLIRLGILDQEHADAMEWKIEDAYTRILGMQLSNGGFSMWRGDPAEWKEGSLFAAHFLLEAERREQIRLDSGSKRKMLQRLAEIAENAGSAQNVQGQRFNRAYAVYLLSLAGNPNFLKNARNILNSDAKGYDTFLAAAAMIRSGYAGEVADIMNQMIRENFRLQDGWDTGGLQTRNKLLGMTLMILTDCNLQNAECCANLAALLIRGCRQNQYSWNTTQDNAWAVLGLTAYLSSYPEKGFHADLIRNGKTESYQDGKKLELPLLPDHPVTVVNRGEPPLRLLRRTTGFPKQLPAQKRIIKLKREYLTANPEIKQGDAVTVRLTIESPVPVRNLVIADLLPSGLEIEDGTLATRANEGHAFNTPQNGYFPLDPRRTEPRDDRYLIFTDLNAGKYQFTYQARAVLRGTFRLPPLTAEAMYEPEINGIFANGQETMTDPRTGEQKTVETIGSFEIK